MGLPCDYRWFDIYVKTHFRYRYEREVNQYIEAVVESSASRVTRWGKATSLWRAQGGCRVCRDRPGDVKVWKDDNEGYSGYPQDCRPFSAERMKPEPEKTKEGRINPKGIPCLSLPTHQDTAMSEVRSWRGARITL